MSGIIAQNSGRHTGLIKAASGAGVWTLINTITASSDSSVDFTSGIDGTYAEYIIKFHDVHTSNTVDASYAYDLNCNFSIDGGSNFNVTKTSSTWRTRIAESGAYPTFAHYSDQNQVTTDTLIADDPEGDNDQSTVGYMHLFNPSDTTFVKHFIIVSQYMHGFPTTAQFNSHGYCNTTSAVDAVTFIPSGGTIDAGSFSLYGIS